MDLPDPTDELTGDLTALLGSRICHDLISPLGAIGNGVELLSMVGGTGPEVTLIAESVRAANARVRFFRVAFGAAGAGQRMARAEVLSILDDFGQGGRLRYGWQGPADAPRTSVKMAFLALLCLETALPWGGDAAIAAEGEGWTVMGRAARMKLDPALWDRLRGPAPREGLQAAHVQFALLPDEARRQGRTLALTVADDRIAIRF